jgi:hypothetical protein
MGRRQGEGPLDYLVRSLHALFKRLAIDQSFVHIRHVLHSRAHISKTFGGPVVALLLAGALWCLTIISASPALHGLFHQDLGHEHNACLMCSLVNGQLSAAEVVTVAAVLVFIVVRAPLLQPISPTVAVDYRLSPSRAPPGF